MGVSYLLRGMKGPLGGSDTDTAALPDPDAIPSERDEETEGGKLGPLLDEPSEKKVVAAVVKNWKSQDEGLSRHLAEVEQAEGWRRAERWVYIRRTNNDRQYEVWRPPGIDRLPPLPDKVDELCRRLAAQMTVDGPELEAEPTSGEEADTESAEMASRILEVEGGESGWNFRLLVEGAIDIATTQKSAFGHVWVNPVGRGEKPVTVMAHPAAQQYDPANPEAVQTGPPSVDPATGQQVPGQPTADLVTKFLEQDGTTLADQESATTMRRWRPWVEIKLLGVRHVRFLPEWCRGIGDADGCIVADYVTIGELKQRYPETVGKMVVADLKKLVNWKPFEDFHLLPDHVRATEKIGTWMNREEVPDDAVALALWEYHRQSPVYPKGAQVCVGGNEFVLGKDTLEVHVERPDGSEVPEILEIPVSQNKCLNDWVGLSPQGHALVTKMGPWNEVMATQWVAVGEWLDRANNPFMFLPAGSNLAGSPDQVAVRDGRPIIVAGGEPVMERVAPLAPEVKEWYDRAVAGLNSASLLSETANATELPNVNSGVQANTIIHQVQVAMSSVQANATDFLIRTGRLVLQRLRANITVPETVRYVGDDASYRADEWRGADLFGTRDVRLKRGTFTGLNPDQKRALIFQDVQMQVLPLEDAAESLIEGTTAKVGLEDDPVRLRIKRQVEAFLDEGAPFEPLPVDDVPVIAAKRFRELAKRMMSTRFSALEPEQKQAYAAEYDRARQAAGVMTKAEEAQAAQAQAAQAMEQQVAMEARKAEIRQQADIGKMQTEAEIESTIPAKQPTLSVS